LIKDLIYKEMAIKLGEVRYHEAILIIVCPDHWRPAHPPESS
jgi:hypothetical protein